MQNEPISQDPMPQIQASEQLPALPAPREGAPPSRDGWQRALGCLLRVGLGALVIAAVVAAVYFGWPVVYARYVLPVQDNTTRVAAVEIHQQAGEEQLAALQTQLPAQSTTLASQAERIAALESAGKDGDQALATAQAGQTAALATLTTLVPRMNALQSTQGALQSTLKALESAGKEQSEALAALQNTQGALQAADAGGRAELDRQVTLLKSMELLSRARLFLYQSNFGLAKQDIQAARDLLAALPDPSGDPDLAEVLQDLNQALARLPDFPVAASDDLDTAWQILLGGQPATPTPSETPGNTPTPTP